MKKFKTTEVSQITMGTKADPRLIVETENPWQLHEFYAVVIVSDGILCFDSFAEKDEFIAMTQSIA